MAGRRAAVKAIDWLTFAEYVPPNQIAMFNAFKSSCDTISAKLAFLPEKPPTIDWAYYKSTLGNASIVDEFEKKYAALKIPEPVETYTAEIDALEKEADKSAAAYIKESKAMVIQYEERLEKYKTMVPFDQMTVDEFNEYFPETKLDKKKYPFWPHMPIADL
uniref:ATP synthase subunit d, mitochondrial n=1 Tax=Sphenodon punctatus TaxID=8508 RepID=A0A8D0GWX9_SPHPU